VPRRWRAEGHLSHGPEGDIVDLYTTLPWSALCEEVIKPKIAMPGPVQIPAAATVAASEPIEPQLDEIIEPIADESADANDALDVIDQLSETAVIAEDPLESTGGGRALAETAEGLLPRKPPQCKPSKPFDKGGGVDGTRTRFEVPGTTRGMTRPCTRLPWIPGHLERGSRFRITPFRSVWRTMIPARRGKGVAKHLALSAVPCDPVPTASAEQMDWLPTQRSPTAPAARTPQKANSYCSGLFIGAANRRSRSRVWTACR